MNTINANELIAAGYNFTIEDENSERCFDNEGELVGVSFEMPEYYFAADLPDDQDEMGSYLCDVSELSDDHAVTRPLYDDEGEPLCSNDGFEIEEIVVHSRWGHVKDEHLDELEAQRNLYRRLDTQRRDHREMFYLAQWRVERYERLLRCALGTLSDDKLKKMKSGIWSRYKASVKSCAKSESWYAIYLTKEQVGVLMAVINLRLGR
jgi:hypothetical protein